MSDWEPDSWEPGYDPGPDADDEADPRFTDEGTCDYCERTAPLNDDCVCEVCDREAAEDEARENAAYRASGQYTRTSWGWGEDFGADR